MTAAPGRAYDPIAISTESTVVAEYVPEPGHDTAYQSEAALERELIALLKAQAYEYLPITSEAQLVANLRAQLETLNGITFTDGEWATFFSERIAGANDTIIEKSVRVQEDHIQLLKRDDGTVKNVTIKDSTLTAAGFPGCVDGVVRGPPAVSGK